MALAISIMGAVRVALRKESVDRNGFGARKYMACSVALRKESVDRNFKSAKLKWPVVVALRKESVDRNSQFGVVFRVNGKSLSARRAWIEIPQLGR